MESSAESDLPVPITIYNSQTTFQKLVVPASMRSQYWRYFGFPADDSNNILTREKIVCCICRRQIAYNKNTTNLSTHLIAKHIDIMQKYFPNDIKPSSSAKRLKTSKTPNKRVKCEKNESDRWSDDYVYAKTETEAKEVEILTKTDANSESLRVLVTTEDGEEFIETLDYDECPGIFGLDSPSFSGEEPNESSQHEFLNEEYLISNAAADNDVASQAPSQEGDQEKIFIDVYVDKTSKRSPQKKATADNGAPATKLVKYGRESRETSNRLGEPDVAEAIKNFVVSDILSPSIVDGIGFHSLLKSISGHTDIPIPDSSKVNPS